MEFIGVTCLFSFTVNRTEVNPDASGLQKIMPLIPAGFMPSVFEENITGTPKKVMKVEKRTGVINTSITFGTNQVSIEYSSENEISEEWILSNLDENCASLQEILTETKIDRLSCVCNHLLRNVDKKLEDKIYQSFFKDENNNIEWNFRLAKKEKVTTYNTFNVLSINKGFAVIQINGIFSNCEALVITSDNNTQPNQDLSGEEISNTLLFKGLYEKSKKQNLNILG